MVERMASALVLVDVVDALVDALVYALVYDEGGAADIAVSLVQLLFQV